MHGQGRCGYLMDGYTAEVSRAYRRARNVIRVHIMQDVEMMFPTTSWVGGRQHGDRRCRCIPPTNGSERIRGKRIDRVVASSGNRRRRACVEALAKFNACIMWPAVFATLPVARPAPSCVLVCRRAHRTYTGEHGSGGNCDEESCPLSPRQRGLIRWSAFGEHLARQLVSA